MPYDIEKPDAALKDKIRARHPRATASAIRQWIHVWNGTFSRMLASGKTEKEAEGIAFRNAWGVLKKNLSPAKAVAASEILAGLADFFPRADEHQLAAASTGGRTVVAAGAGSGKTTMMVAKIAHAVRELKIPPSQFLVCSFGGKSTDDMKEKITRAVGAQAASDMQIATIHGMCRREMIAWGVPEGKLLASDSHTPLFGSAQTSYLNILIEVVELKIGQRLPAGDLTVGDIAMQFEKWKGNAKHPADVLTKTEISECVRLEKKYGDDGMPYLVVELTDKPALIAIIYNLYEAGKFPQRHRIPEWIRLKWNDEQWISKLSTPNNFHSQEAVKRLGVAYKFVDGPRMDFFDMQTAFLWYLRNDSQLLAQLQGKYTQIYVDECQDTSPLQFDVVLTLGSHVETDDPRRTLWMVGDDKQSIYFFRGTRPQQFIDLAKSSDWKLRKMPNNYRSTGPIVAMANALVAHNQNQIDMPAIAAGPNRDLQDDIELHRPYDRLAGVDRTIGKIRDKMAAVTPGPSFQDFAVICRTNNELGDYELKMLLEGIPYTRKGGQNFLGSMETQALLNYVKIAQSKMPRVLHEALSANLNMPPRDMLSSRDFRDAFAGGNGGLQDIEDCAKGRGAVGKTQWRYESFKPRAVASCTSYLDQIRAIRTAAASMDTEALLNFILDNVRGWTKEGEGPTLREAIHAKLGEGEESSEEAGAKDEADGSLRLNIGNAEVLFTILKYKTATAHDLTSAGGFLSRVEEITQMAEANSAKTTKLVMDPRTGKNKRVKMDAPDAVSLVTAHASKGLEWDYTFVQMPLYTFPLLGIVMAAEEAADALASLSDEERRFPDKELRERILIWEDAVAEYEAERRLAYVALTRAKKGIYISSPQTTKSGKPAGPSPFVFEAEVEEHATYSDMESMFDYDSLDEAIQFAESSGKDRAAMMLTMLKALMEVGNFAEARLMVAKNRELWPIVLNTRGTRQIQPTGLASDWWPTPEEVRKFIPLAEALFGDNDSPDNPGGKEPTLAEESEQYYWDMAKWHVAQAERHAAEGKKDPANSKAHTYASSAHYNARNAHVKAAQRDGITSEAAITRNRAAARSATDNAKRKSLLAYKQVTAGFLDDLEDLGTDFDLPADDDFDTTQSRKKGAMGLPVSEVQHWIGEIFRAKLFDVSVGKKMVKRKVSQSSGAITVYLYKGAFDTDGISTQILDLFEDLGRAFGREAKPDHFICDSGKVVAASLARVTDKKYKVWIAIAPNRTESVGPLITAIRDRYFKIAATARVKPTLELVAEDPAVLRSALELGFVELSRDLAGPVMGPQTVTACGSEDLEAYDGPRGEDGRPITAPDMTSNERKTVKALQRIWDAEEGS